MAATPLMLEATVILRMRLPIRLQSEFSPSISCRHLREALYYHIHPYPIQIHFCFRN
jgi:hypothetical protein